MTLTINKEEDEQRQLKVTVQVDEDRVQRAMRKIARNLAREVNVPGFRRGKAPYNVIVRRFGADSIRAEAAEDLVEEIFPEVLDELEAEPYAPASLENLDVEPLVFTFTVPLTPVIELGDYRALRREIVPVSIEDEAVDKALLEIQRRHQVLEPVDRPAALGDVVTVAAVGTAPARDSAGEGVDAENEVGAAPASAPDIEAATDRPEDEPETEAAAPSESLLDEERIDFLLEEETVYFGPEFVTQLVGLTAGDKKRFSIAYPADYDEEELAGRTVAFTVEVLDVKRRELPALDDDLAREEGDYETLAELKDKLRQDLHKEAEEQARSDLFDTMVDDMVAGASLVYPPAAVERELDHMLDGFRQQVTQMGWTWQDYLRLDGKSEATLRDSWREQATRRLERGLVLHSFIEQERLKVDDAELSNQIARRLEEIESPETREIFSELFAGESGAGLLSNELLVDKAYARMKEILSGEAPELDAPEPTSDEEE